MSNSAFTGGDDTTPVPNLDRVLEQAGLAVGSYLLLANGQIVTVPYPAFAVDSGDGRAIPGVMLVNSSGQPVTISGGGGGGSTSVTTTTEPSSAPNNAAGTTGVSLYSDPAGNLLTHDALLAGLISSGKLLVSDSALEALINGAKLTVSDTTLDAIVSGGRLPITTDGTAPTGETVDAGGSGTIGWLGSIATACRNILTKVSGTLSVATVGAVTSKAIAAAAVAGVAKGAAGILYGVVITASGSAQLTLTDGPGGNVIAVVPASQVVGDLYISCPRAFATSLYVNSGSNTPAVTLLYS